MNEELLYRVNHLFLPPKLPQAYDGDPSNELSLVAHIVASASEFSERLEKIGNTPESNQWKILRRMFARFQLITSGTGVPMDPELMMRIVGEMVPGDVLPVYIAEQNAGVIVRMSSTDQYTFESFPLLLPTATVTGTQGKVIVSYPATPRIPFPVDSQFREALCSFLADFHITKFPAAIPQTKKAGSSQNETRDSAYPFYVTHFLSTVLRGLSADRDDSILPPTTYITKRIGDHVLWDAAELPWRRSPLLVLLKVTLQTTLAEAGICDQYGYKAFMAFMLSRALADATRAGLPDDLLVSMNAKLGHRVYKLRDSSAVIERFPFDAVSVQVAATQEGVEARWKAYQEEEARPIDLTPPTRDELEAARVLSLKNSRAYLEKVIRREEELRRPKPAFDPAPFEAGLPKRMRVIGNSPPHTFDPAASLPDLLEALLDVTLWLESGAAAAWMDIDPTAEILETRRGVLDGLLQCSLASLQRFQQAQAGANPELFSMVMLIVMDLWVLLDKTCISAIPLLAEYSPELTIAPLEALLLPEKGQMKRLSEIEDYISQRHDRATHGSVFRLAPGEDCHRAFGARYAQQNDEMLRVRDHIQRAAERAKQKKQEEWKSMSEEYEDLVARARSSSCQYVTLTNRWGNSWQKHSHDCQKCRLEETAKGMRITLFEDPLPNLPNLALLVVFELQVPHLYSLWRATTYALIKAHGRDSKTSTGDEPVCTLAQYSTDMQAPLFEAAIAARSSDDVVLASSAKSWLQTHHSRSSFPCIIAAVVKPHALRYRFYDALQALPPILPELALRAHCTLTIPSGPYECLAWTVSSTSHTPNEVIARQSSCAPDVTLHEWEAYGHLRAGTRLQWRNIALQLEVATINFADSNVHVLLRQAALQAEERAANSSYTREAHADLAEPEFGTQLLECLRRRLELISHNWQESWTVSSLALICRRLYFLLPVHTPSGSSVRRDIVNFLQAELRPVALRWVREIGTVVRTAEEAGKTIAATLDLRNLLIQAAVGCRETFNVDSDIFDSPDAVADFLECSIVLHQQLPCPLSTLPTTLRILVEAGTLQMMSTLSRLLRHSNLDAGLTKAMGRIWPNFNGTGWRDVRGTRGWMTCRTESTEHEQSRTVHLDISNGSIFVDGLSFGVLPEAILEHDLFREVFPHQRQMRILPSQMHGMTYQSQYLVRDHKLHLLQQGTELVIRAQNVWNGSVSEFIPQMKLKGDITNFIWHDHIALYSKGDINFYSRDRSLSWTTPEQAVWRIENAGPASAESTPKLNSIARSECILCPHSPVSQRLGDVLAPLERSRLNVAVIMDPGHSSGSDSAVVVRLPRYTMEFYFDSSGRLTSKELPEFAVARSQVVDTLYGVQKLVLETADQLSRRQCILVPSGSITVSSRPEIHPSDSLKAHIRALVFHVDPLVGRLTHDGSLESWLTLAYLHALSSSHQPDPLTGERGTERALSMLKSAVSFAFTGLTDRQHSILRQIAAITPVRTYYPTHLRVMEKTAWHGNLSFLSQNDLYVSLATKIVNYAQSLVSLTRGKEASGWSLSYKGEDKLRQRALCRSAHMVTSSALHLKEHVLAHEESYGDASYHISDPPEVHRQQTTIVSDVAFRVSHWDRDGIATARSLWNHCLSWSREFSITREPITLDTPYIFPHDDVPPYIWFSLFDSCRSTTIQDRRYPLLLTLALLAYNGGLPDELVYSIMALSLSSTFRQPDILSACTLLPKTSINLSDGWDMDRESVGDLASVVRKHAVEFSSSAHYDWSRRPRETPEEYQRRCLNGYETSLKQQTDKFIQALTAQWPCSSLVWQRIHAVDDFSLLQVDKLKPLFDTRFESMHNNYQLHKHFAAMQRLLDSLSQPMSSQTLRTLPSPPSPTQQIPCFQRTTISYLMESRRAPQPCTISIRCSPSYVQAAGVRSLLGSLEPRDGFMQQYHEDLTKCVSAMEVGRTYSSSIDTVEMEVPALERDDMERALQPRTSFEKLLHASGCWPRMGTHAFLALLTSTRRQEIPRQEWLHALLLLAESLLRRQRERRLYRLTVTSSDYQRELDTNIGEGYDLYSHPDWVLFQLDSDVTVRRVQADIAYRMIRPQSGSNEVMQLNMGEGKSSVIIPMTATACANGENLVCVVVLKPLCSQMFHLLSQRICGLANRRLFYLPFSRDTPISPSSVSEIDTLFKTCAEVGGVLLCQPDSEHLLSFQLMATSMLCSEGMSPVTESLLETQNWLTRHSRYILDESDEILSVKYQLIYTLGSPGPLEGQPERWQIIQQVLGVVMSNVSATLSAHPEGLDLEGGEVNKQQFRRLRILTDAACQDLLSRTIRDILSWNKISSLSFRTYTSDMLQAVERFIVDPSVDMTTADELTQISAASDTYPHLLLLRGLFAHGILALALKEKRWRVDYGLHLVRTRLAVPYRAKDSPALRAEFGHPDVILILTTLSYYYGGISSQAFDTTLNVLLTTDNPALRYEYWTRGVDLPASLRTLRGVNLQDSMQIKDVLYPALRRVKSVVDFYLSECVFPKEARQFEHKLTTNAWDIARSKVCPTTGFSGTNDNKYLLPTSISQNDSSAQLHTNALVLSFLRLPENRRVVSRDCTADGLIDCVVHNEQRISVILDVGAQILELDNAEMARRWLDREMRPDIEAAVYFGEDDELYVRTRDGRIEVLRRSFYRDQLGKALVYLDEAHTRGTDLKFPHGARAMVTLGPKLTKDKLVQGCMRMRKLGQENGHFVVFLASSEIRRKIRESIRNEKENLDSSDVLVWTMHETIRQTKENGALWANQGLNFDARQSAWDAFNDGTLSQEQLVRCLQEREARPLQDLYGPRTSTEEAEAVETRIIRQREIFERCQKFQFGVSRGSRLLEEQERELAHEKQSEREVQRAPPTRPKSHKVDPSLLSLVAANIDLVSDLRTLRQCLTATSVYGMLPSLSDYFFQGTAVVATRDFVETVQTSADTLHEKDLFLRSVQWIVSTSTQPDTLVLISPFEANAILPRLRRHDSVQLHMYAPRTSRTSRFFDDLTFLVVPVPSPNVGVPLIQRHPGIHELNLFAGSLFLRDERDYSDVCAILGLHLGEITKEYQGKVQVDGFVISPDLRARPDHYQFKTSPTVFLKRLLDLRRKGQGFLLTHIGSMLHGKAVERTDF